MIQRIQTVYLALVAVLCGVSLCSTIGRFANDTEVVASFTNFCFSTDANADITGPWPFAVLIIIVLLLTVMSIFGFAAIFELIEWCYAAMADAQSGTLFLGSQGDIWDAQKDMLADGLGAICTTAAYCFIRPAKTE